MTRTHFETARPRRAVAILGLLVLVGSVGTSCSSSDTKGNQTGVSASCGNGVVDDPNEACDGIAMPVQVTCAFATGNPAMQGFVACNSSCRLDTSGCVPGGVVSPKCGNNVVDDASEACDGTSMPVQVTCAFATGNPASQGFVGCNAQCKLDSSRCVGGPPSSGGFTGAGGLTGAGGFIGGNGGTIGAGGVTGSGGVVLGSGGVVGSGGDQGTGGVTGTGGSISTPGEPKIPPTPTDCPTLRTGNINVLGHTVAIQVGTKRTDVEGPVMFYWHGTGGNATEVSRLGPAAQEIVSMGGIVASFNDSMATGQSTGNNVWYVDDFKMADYILGCAVSQLNIDTHMIYTAGCSAGGLQAGAMVYARSSYLAAAMPNSGGSLLSQLEDPTHVPSLITAHGSCSDKVIIFFGNMSRAECRNVDQQGGIAVDCDHGGGHCGVPAALVAAQWQFCKDHPFGITADPYANGFPAGFPAFAQYCTQYPDPNPPADCQ